MYYTCIVPVFDRILVAPDSDIVNDKINHLFLSFQTEEQERIRHKFRHYYFHRPRVCFLCKQRIFSQGSACQSKQ